MAPLHILAGTLGLLSGAVALYAVKGGKLHRASGLLAAYALLLLSATGIWLAVTKHVEANAIGGLLTAYLLFTALRTVGSQSAKSPWQDVAAMLAAFSFGLGCVVVGLATLAAGKSQRSGIPVPILLVFGSVALLSSLADWRWIRSPGTSNHRNKVVRHLWRMCLAMFIASSSFFLGPEARIPEPLRTPGLRAILAFLPLAVMLFTLARIRMRRPSPNEPQHWRE